MVELVEELYREQLATYPSPDGPYDDPAQYAPPGGLFLIAVEPGGQAVGCGGYRAHGDELTVEIRKMFTRPDVRGSGAGAAILRALETSAAATGKTRMVLETPLAAPPFGQKFRLPLRHEAVFGKPFVWHCRPAALDPFPGLPDGLGQRAAQQPGGLSRVGAHRPGRGKRAPQRDLRPLRHALVDEPLLIDPLEQRVRTGGCTAGFQEAAEGFPTRWSGDVERAGSVALDKVEDEGSQIPHVNGLDRPIGRGGEDVPAGRDTVEPPRQPSDVFAWAQHDVWPDSEPLIGGIVPCNGEFAADLEGAVLVRIPCSGGWIGVRITPRRGVIPR